MKFFLLIIALTTLSLAAHAQNVNIPDANFKAYLVGNSSINTNSDAEIQVSEAAAFTGAIFCPSLNIADLTGIQAFTNVTTLSCQNNQLTTLDLSNNIGLTTLMCFSNQINMLTLGSNASLQSINCSGNQLSTLDVSNCPNLIDLVCSQNALNVLDLSSHTNLTYLHCFINQLTTLNVANGNNTAMTSFNATSNPNLTCIEVDDAAYSTANWSSGIPATASFSEDCANFCTVSIPDANFKAYLVANTLINTNNDTEIQCSEAQAFTGMIYCPNLSISDLTGIEAFTSLNSLHCFNNQITTIDLSNNSLIAGIICFNNNISSLNISSNNLLDNIDCSNNPLTSIDLTNKPNLRFLTCSGNQFTSLDLSNKPDLEYLNCQNNQLTSLDFSGNLNLTEVYVGQNQITSLELSHLQDLAKFSCHNNALTFLNVKNGNNINFTSFFAYGNPNLTCIEVDDAAWSTTNWTSIDATASFSENCTTSSIEENNVSSNSISIFPNPAQDIITISDLPLGAELSILDITGKVMFSAIVNSNQLIVNTDEFSNGIYLVNVNTNGSTSTKKLVVNK
jgi:Leucine-rich repeat (LRR) protein